MCGLLRRSVGRSCMKERILDEMHVSPLFVTM
jgi:hypothetical protein